MTDQREVDLNMAKSCLLVARDCLAVFIRTNDEKDADDVKLMMDRANKRMSPYLEKKN